MTTPEETQSQDQSQDQSQSQTPLMKLVIYILGAGLLLAIATMAVLAFMGKSIPTELNTLASLIAGGLIGYLAPHVVNSLTGKQN